MIVLHKNKISELQISFSCFFILFYLKTGGSHSTVNFFKVDLSKIIKNNILSIYIDGSLINGEILRG